MERFARQSGFLEFGSTSIKFYVVCRSGEAAGEVEHEAKVPWDLGYDVFEHGRIRPRSITHCVGTIRKFQAEFPEVPFDGVTAVGTAALREALNVDVFQRVLWEELGIKIQIIEGGIEAFLLETGFRGQVSVFPTGLFDLGGGSLELIEYLSSVSTRKTSFPVGAIRVDCRVRRARELYEYVREGRALVAETLEEHLVPPRPRYGEVVGTGGTVRAIATCLDRDHFGLEEIRDLIRREISGPIQAELAPHRRKLLLPGLIAVEGLMKALGARCVRHRQASVKRGLISLSRLLPASPG